MTSEQALQPAPGVDMALHRARIEEAELRMRRSGWRRHLPQRGHLVLLPLSIIMVLPFVWMVLTSFMTDTEINSIPPALWPHHLYTGGYSAVLASSDFPYWFLNSLIVSGAAVIAQLVLCSLAGYAFARIPFPGSRVVFFLLLATLMVPFQVVMVPTFLIVRHLGLIDTLGALILPNLVSPFGIFLLRQFFRTVPIELEEAARIDGCSRLGVLLRIVLPLSGPALATLAVITFLWTWNDFLWPLIVIQSPDNNTIQLGLANFQGSHQTQWTLLMAGNVMSLLPMLLVFVVAQKWFVQSVAATGLRG